MGSSGAHSGRRLLLFSGKKKAAAGKREEVKEQFKELMLLASTGQKAGYSTENAFLSGYGDMKRLYGGQSTICRMLQRLKTGMENHTDFGKMWRQMGQDVDIPEIEEFARVYEVAYKSSGNMSAVMEKPQRSLSKSWKPKRNKGTFKCKSVRAKDHECNAVSDHVLH